ncbi:STAS domain-containing protein [Kitasatospora purpeofusca]|uniref:STAS domain-containing protein n=1 Tax=Kitasatospora purpeofusca TaxID=67352 RepID=UPI00340C4E6E
MNLSAGDAGDAGNTGGAGGGRDPGQPRALHPGELRIEVRRTGPVRIVSVAGELDRDSVAGLRTALAGLPEEGLTRILVDLAGLSFCDSTGLNVLLRARQEAEPAGVRLELAGPRPVVVRLLAVTGADTVLRIHSSVAVALAAGGGRPGGAGPTDPSGPGGPGPAVPERP